MGNLPFERTRYNPVRDVTADEAEQNKRQHSEQDAAMRDPKAGDQPVPPDRDDEIAGESGE